MSKQKELRENRKKLAEYFHLSDYIEYYYRKSYQDGEDDIFDDGGKNNVQKELVIMAKEEDIQFTFYPLYRTTEMFLKDEAKLEEIAIILIE